MAYLYRHIRLDKNIPFYIGIGENKDGGYSRAFDKQNRRRNSSIWKRIVAKTEYEVEILLDEISWEEACKKEKEFIKLYGRINIGTGILANMTDGGEGAVNMRHSEESKKKMSEKRRGIKYPEERNIKIAETLKRKYKSGERKSGTKGRKHTDEWKTKNSERNKGKKHTDEAKKKMSLLMLGNKRNVGKKLSEEQKRKIGEKNSVTLKGRKLSEETKRKIAEAGRGRKHSAETKIKCSIAQRGRIVTEEQRRKISETLIKFNQLKKPASSRLKILV